jgi:hypothetical protein
LFPKMLRGRLPCRMRIPYNRSVNVTKKRKIRRWGSYPWIRWSDRSRKA